MAAMKLYDVPRNSRVELVSGKQLNFERIDGMYSYCTDDEGKVWHIPATTEVLLLPKQEQPR
jgi:hypothetical protein